MKETIKNLEDRLEIKCEVIDNLNEQISELKCEVIDNLNEQISELKSLIQNIQLNNF